MKFVAAGAAGITRAKPLREERAFPELRIEASLVVGEMLMGDQPAGLREPSGRVLPSGGWGGLRRPQGDPGPAGPSPPPKPTSAGERRSGRSTRVLMRLRGSASSCRGGPSCGGLGSGNLSCSTGVCRRSRLRAAPPRERVGSPPPKQNTEESPNAPGPDASVGWTTPPRTTTATPRSTSTTWSRSRRSWRRPKRPSRR